MNLNQEDMTPAFKNWLQSKEFYTGEIGDANLSNWDGIVLTAGAKLAKTAAKAILKQPIYGSTKFLSAQEAEKAEADLAGLRNEFDFVGFKTKWNTPTLILGLSSDNLTTPEIKSLFSTVPQQVGILKNYGNSLHTKLLLIYLNPIVYEHHCTELVSSGTVLNQPWSTIFRTCFIDVQGKQLQWSPRGGLLGENKFVSKLHGKESFEKDDLLQILGSIL